MLRCWPPRPNVAQGFFSRDFLLARTIAGNAAVSRCVYEQAGAFVRPAIMNSNRRLELSCLLRVGCSVLSLERTPPMKKIALAVATAAVAFTAAPLFVGAVPAKAENLQMAQGIDVQVGRDRDRIREERIIRPRRDREDVTIGAARAASSSARENVAARSPPGSKGTMAARSRAGSASAIERGCMMEMVPASGTISPYQTCAVLPCSGRKPPS